MPCDLLCLNALLVASTFGFRLRDLPVVVQGHSFVMDLLLRGVLGLMKVLCAYGARGVPETVLSACAISWCWFCVATILVEQHELSGRLAGAFLLPLVSRSLNATLLDFKCLCYHPCFSERLAFRIPI